MENLDQSTEWASLPLDLCRWWVGLFQSTVLGLHAKSSHIFWFWHLGAFLGYSPYGRNIHFLLMLCHKLLHQTFTFFYFLHNVSNFSSLVVYYSAFLLLDSYLLPSVLLMNLDQIFWREVQSSVSRSITRWFIWYISHQNILKNHVSSSTVI